MFFVQDGNTTQNWRLKGHAVDAFWQWCGSWAIAARMPDDLGMPMPGYDLPELRVVNHDVDYDAPPDQATLFQLSVGINDMRRIRGAAWTPGLRRAPTLPTGRRSRGLSGAS